MEYISLDLLTLAILVIGKYQQTMLYNQTVNLPEMKEDSPLRLQV